MRQMVWAFFRQLSGLKIRDMTSGFKVYHRAAAECLCARPTSKLGYQDVPTLLLLTEFGFKIMEFPVTMEPRRPGTGISRVFSSWGKVFIYLSRVSTDCLIFRGKTTFRWLSDRIKNWRPEPELASDAKPMPDATQLEQPSKSGLG
jgi:hypothetical protein